MPTETTTQKKKDCQELNRKERACRKLAGKQPDKTLGVDITGRYEQAENPPQFTCQINQAGIYLEGRIQFFIVAQEGQKLDEIPFLPTLKFKGELIDVALKKFSIQILNEKNNTKVGLGSIIVNKTNRGFKIKLNAEIHIDDSIKKRKHKISTELSPSELFSEIPKFPEELISSFNNSKIKDEMDGIEVSPVPIFYLREIEKIFSRDRMIGLIEKWFEYGDLPRSAAETKRKTLIKYFDEFVGEFLNRFHKDLIPAIRWNLRIHFASMEHNLKKQFSHKAILDWLIIIITQTPYLKYDTISKKEIMLFPHLGKDGLNLIDERIRSEEITYFATLDVKGGVLPVPVKTFVKVDMTIMYGKLSIKKKGETDNSIENIGEFRISLGYFGLSVDILDKSKIMKGKLNSLKGEGVAQSPYKWGARDFIGYGQLISFSASTSKWIGLSPSYTKLGITGSGVFPPLIFTFKKISTILGKKFVGKGGIAWVEISDSEGQRNVPLFLGIEESVKPILLYHEAKEKNHFDFGCATLTKEGRELLRRFCAHELFFLYSPLSTLEIYGHTDSVDCERRNLELSEMRAKNVLQAIKDILGNKFAIPKNNIIIKGYGEQFAIKSISDNTKSQEWRKVEIKLNGVNSVRLFG